MYRKNLNIQQYPGGIERKEKVLTFGMPNVAKNATLNVNTVRPTFGVRVMSQPATAFARGARGRARGSLGEKGAYVQVTVQR